MTSVALAWSAAWILVAAAVGVRLWRASTGREPFVRSGYRWLAAGALCLGVGGALQQAFGGVVGGAQPLRVADLIGLGALPAIIIGLATITADRSGGDRGHAEPTRWRLTADWAAQVRPGSGAVIDSALLVVSLFAIGLVTLFGAAYTRSAVGPAAFALDLVRPVADLAALGLALTLVPRNPRLTAGAALGLVAVTIADSLAVAARSVGSTPGIGAHLALAAGIALLAATPAAARLPKPVPWSRWLGTIWSDESRMAAPAAAAAAALVIAGVAVFGRLDATAAVAVTAAIGVILLVIRLGWLARRADVVTASAQAVDGVFRTLADSTTDTVLICDRTGIIEYVSHGGGEFGYGNGNQAGPGMVGTALADLVHPEDRRAGVRAGMTALRSSAGTATFTGRARSADGSWRQVKAMISRYGQPGEPARLLITCHDDSEVVALRRQLAQLTFHDGLTGLPNRTYLEDRVKDLRHEADEGTTVAAILVGLDGLDAHSAMADPDGSHGENLVLAQAGRRLRAAAPPDAMVARWGSQQFAVLIGDIGLADDRQRAAELAERLADAIGAVPFAIDTKEVWVTASVGVATSQAACADQVLGNAHVAMIKAARAGGARVKVFGTAMAAMTRRRIELAAALGEAVTDHQIQVEYRPVVELATSLVTGVEAVLCWCLAGERISSSELLAVAEESGLIVELGDLLLREGVRQVAKWRATGQPIGLMVRVSARQLSAPGFAASVSSALDAAELPTRALTLAVDEQVLLDGGAMPRSELAALRATGVRIAIDEFGTGQASLSYLRQLSVDVIKIGSSLTAGLGTDPTLTLLTSAISRLARDLGIETVAAGIDRPDQVELLQAMGCGLGQGSWLADEWSRDQAGDPACSPAS